MKHKKKIGLGIVIILIYTFLFGDIPHDSKAENMIYISKNNNTATVKLKDIVDIQETRSDYNELSASVDKKSIVSFSKNNPMLILSGKYSIHNDTVLVEGTGMRNTFSVKDEVVIVKGVKNYVTIDGSPKEVIIKGVANKVQIEKIQNLTIKGICNRAYYNNRASKTSIYKNGFINFAKETKN